MSVDLNFLVGGQAGQGIQTIGFVLGKTMARGGLHVFADQDYESRIRGGHNFFRVRVKDGEVKAQNERLDILIAMDKVTIERHRGELKENGVIILDAQSLNLVPGSFSGQGIDKPEPGFVDIPLEKLALEVAGNKIMSNTVAVGAMLGLIGFDFNILAAVIRWHFAKNVEKVQEDNVKAARAGYDFASQHIPQTFTQKVTAARDGNCMFINGSDALSLGAMAAGCKFLAAYPMTPTTPILEFMADKGRDYDIAVVQPEDEISGINMAIGAGFTGVRAMTATSGSGFALMVEGLGLAGITETPVVIVLGERPGPAVGLPTRTEQGELLFAIQAGTGEFPRAVLAPATAEDAFYLTAKAFNLAEKYQSPVIILTDTHLANSFNNVDKFDLQRVKIERGALLSYEDANKLSDYKRHRLTESGISPRVLPMQSRALVVTDSDEHDEAGHLTESAEIRTQQVAKRLKKQNGLKSEISPPRFIEMPGAGMTLIGWGSTYGAILEASQELKKEGIASNILHFTEIWPFPAEFVSTALKKTPQNIVIESNATGQLAYLIHAETGYEGLQKINKWDGRPISCQYILDELRKVVK
jgi:2-oxoglutarate/2-oxoacid ferredoxin oxidoreductase subunit alpha